MRKILIIGAMFLAVATVIHAERPAPISQTTEFKYEASQLQLDVVAVPFTMEIVAAVPAEAAHQVALLNRNEVYFVRMNKRKVYHVVRTDQPARPAAVNLALYKFKTDARKEIYKTRPPLAKS